MTILLQDVIHQYIYYHVEIVLTIYAIAFYGQEFAHSTIIGATKLEQLKENIAAEKTILSEELVSEINKLFNEYPDPAL